MSLHPRAFLLLFVASLVALTGCPSRPPETCGNGQLDQDEQCDDGNLVSGDGCDADCTAPVAASCGNGTVDEGEACDDGNQLAGDGCEPDCTQSPVACPGASLPPPASGTCTVVPGDAQRLYTGVLLLPGQVIPGGQVLVDATGTITCAACDCTASAGAATATQVICPKAVISPGLINSHDHITFQAAPYTTSSTERYEHRHDWRVGNDNHQSISSGGTASNAMVRWGELRQVMSGTTSIAGSGGQAGLLRNLDRDLREGLAGAQARYETFPLGDSNGTERTSGCNYPDIDSPSVIPPSAAYLPHIAEGIEASARNEFLCLSTTDHGGQDLIGARTAIIHGIGLNATDIAQVASEQASLIWSPRSNIVLYGDTAAVALYRRLGVNIALGTDWVRSGSMNLLRELRCADQFNQNHLQKLLSDEDLWKMVTSSAADALKVTDHLGRLAPGKVADLAIFRQKGEGTYRSVIEANPEDVVLVVRGGKVLYGDQPLVQALSTDSCDALEVCGAQRAICLQSETNETFSALSAANASTYPLFFCNAEPQNEPSCTPARASGNSHNGSSLYTGTPTADDADGDGILDASDNCPRHFNPIRPMDAAKQADADADGVGDVCDVCPLAANTESCPAPNPDDLDGDGIPNGSDNCPGEHNPSQGDSDNDGKGDVCDVCPAPNPGNAACPTTVYALKAQASPLLGQSVAIGNVVVTARAANGYFVQVHESDPGYAGADHSGLFIYHPANAVNVGDRVDLTGTAGNFFGQIQLSGVTAAVSSSNNPLPAATLATASEVATGGARAQALEGVRVRVENVAVTDLNPALGAGDAAPNQEFVVGGALRINDYFYLLTPFAQLGETFASITGVLAFRNGDSKLEPQGPTDLVSGSPYLLSLGPDHLFIRQGASGATVPEALRVSLARPQSTDTAVQLSSGSADLTVDNGGVVTILAGQTSAEVSLTGVAANAAVQLTATLGSVMRNATVRVLAPSESGALVALEPATASVGPGGTATFTARLDLPALAQTPIALSVSPPSGFGSVPATVDVAADQLTASFVFTADPAATGTGTVTAQLGGASVMATLTITQGSSGVVVSELAVAGPGGASDEFVELYNPTATPIALDGYRLQYKSATGNTYQNVGAALPAGATIAAKGYYLLAGTGYQGSVTPDFNVGTGLSFAGAAGHVRIGNPNVGSAKVDANAVDTVGYGATADSPETAAAPQPSGAAASLERKASGTSTSVTMDAGGADELKGNGYDTNDNSADFVVRTTRQPQNQQSATEQ